MDIRAKGNQRSDFREIATIVIVVSFFALGLFYPVGFADTTQTASTAGEVQKSILFKIHKEGLANKTETSQEPVAPKVETPLLDRSMGLLIAKVRALPTHAGFEARGPSVSSGTRG